MATANKVNVRMLGAIGQRDWSGRTRVENMVCQISGMSSVSSSSYQCKYCAKWYSHKSSLCRHVRSFHANDKENDVECEDKKKSFWCTDCDLG